MIVFSLLCNFCSCFLWYPNNNWMNYKSCSNKKKHLYSRGIGVFLILMSILISTVKFGIVNACILQFLIACILTSLIVILYPVKLINSFYIVSFFLICVIAESLLTHACQ